MNIRTLIAKSRPLLSLTLLACAMTLTACLDESCGITSPSEATGSHEGTSSNASGDNLVVQIFYDSELRGLSEIVITSSKGGRITVKELQFGGFVLQNMRKGEQVTFTMNSGAEFPDTDTCTWSGKGKIFGDVGFEIHAIAGGDRTRYDGTCLGW